MSATHENTIPHDAPEGDASSQNSPRPENEKRIVEGTDDVNVDDLDMDQHEYRHIIHKLDWAIIPYCSLLYVPRTQHHSCSSPPITTIPCSRKC